MWGIRSVGTSEACGASPAAHCDVLTEERDEGEARPHGACWRMLALMPTVYPDFPVWKVTEFEDGNRMDQMIESQNDREKEHAEDEPLVCFGTISYYIHLYPCLMTCLQLLCAFFAQNQWIFLWSGHGEELDFRPWRTVLHLMSSHICHLMPFPTCQPLGLKRCLA